MRRTVVFAPALAAAGVLARVGPAEANGAGVHIGDLSDAASIAVIVSGAAVALLFVGIFVMRWRQAARDSGESPVSEDGEDKSGS